MIGQSEISSLMGAVSKADTSLRDEILQIISAANEPMCCKDIYEKSGCAPDPETLSREVYQMTAKAGLLEIAETKAREGFRDVAFYRISALGQVHLHLPYADNKMQIPQAPTKEAPMSAPSKLTTIIYNRIVEIPGIGPTALMLFALNNVPGATEKQVKKSLLNLQHSSKKIRVEGTRGNLSYYQNVGASQPAPAAVPASPAVKKQEAKPASAPGEAAFTLMLTDDNCLHLGIGEEMVMLKPAQTARLKDFMDRVILKGART